MTEGTGARGAAEDKNAAQEYTDVRRKAGRATAVYFLVCTTYIIASSTFVFSFDVDTDTRRMFEIAKGLAFVIVTSGMLYAVLRRLLMNTVQATVRLRRILDSIYDVVLFVDWGSRRILDCNPAVERVFGYKPSELIGGTTKLLHLTSQNFEDFGQTSEEALKEGGRYLGEFQMRRRCGEAFASQHSIGVFSDSSGKVMAVSVVRDISDQKQLEEKLRVSQRLKAIGQITVGVAHDFNNHLTVILSNLSPAYESPSLVGDNKRRVETALQAARRAAQLAATLSASARGQARVPSAVNLADAVTRSMTLLERTFANNIKLVSNAEPSQPLLVLLDSGALDDAILNLAINACDAMPAGGILTISTRRQELSGAIVGVDGPILPGVYGVLSVSDTGVGIAPECLEQVTEPFFTTKDTDKGTGLGLTMIHEFMRASNGSMLIRSAVDHGTTVELFFPIVSS